MSILVRDVAKELAVLPQVAPYSERFYRFLNAAQRKIYLEGNYVGVIGQYNILLYTGILTLPFEMEAILAADIINTPIQVQNMWFEFLQNGPGWQNPTTNVTFPDLYDRGQDHCTIQDPPSPFTVQVYCSVPENPNDFVIVEGLDQNGLAIRTQVSVQNGDGTVTSIWQNGISIPLYNPSGAPTTSTQQFSRVTAITFPADSNGISTRNGDVNIEAVLAAAVNNTPAGTPFLLGLYPYFVTNPTMRRYWFPAAVCLGAPYKPVPVNCLVRRRPVPLSKPTDRLSVENIEALKAYYMAAYKEEEEQYDSASTLQARGKFYLEQEIRKTKSAIDRINVQTRGFAGFPRQPGSL